MSSCSTYSVSGTQVDKKQGFSTGEILPLDPENNCQYLETVLIVTAGEKAQLAPTGYC